MKALHNKLANLEKEATKKFPQYDSFLSKLDSVTKSEKKAATEVLDAGKIVFTLAQSLHSPHGMPPLPKKAFQVVSRARVPVVKVSEKALGVSFDVVLNNNIALRNSLLLAAYAAEPRARQIMLLVKAWAKQRRLNEAPNGTPSSYCHSLLVVFFLMQTPQDIAAMRMGKGDNHSHSDALSPQSPVLPNLQNIPGISAHIVEGFETKFEADVEKARALSGHLGPPDNRSVPELLIAYFEWLSWLLKNPQQWCVSLQQGRLLPNKHLLWRNIKRWRLCVEDPFETVTSPRPHDLGQVLTLEGQRRLLAAAQSMAASLKLSMLWSANDMANEDTTKAQGWVSFLNLKPKELILAIPQHTNSSKRKASKANKEPEASDLTPPSTPMNGSMTKAQHNGTKESKHANSKQRNKESKQLSSNPSLELSPTSKFATLSITCDVNKPASNKGEGGGEQRVPILSRLGPPVQPESTSHAQPQPEDSPAHSKAILGPSKKTAQEPEDALSKLDTEKVILRLLADGRWLALPPLKSKFFKETKVRLRSSLFSDKPVRLESAISNISGIETGDKEKSSSWRLKQGASHGGQDNASSVDPIHTKKQRQRKRRPKQGSPPPSTTQ